MKALKSVLLAASLLVSSTAFADEVSDARVAAERWMKLMDAEEYSAAWNTGAENMRKDMPKLVWNMLSSTVHAPLGQFKSRTFKSADSGTASAGKPASVTLEYVADYQNSHKVSEKFTAIREADGVWRVSGYTLNSDNVSAVK